VLPQYIVNVSAFTRTELLQSGNGVQTFRAHHGHKRVLIRVTQLSFVRKDCDPMVVVEHMRTLHCQIALKYVGFQLDHETLTVVYEDPGGIITLASALSSGRLNSSVAGLGKKGRKGKLSLLTVEFYLGSEKCS
jgi:hypothetical protein